MRETSVGLSASWAVIRSSFDEFILNSWSTKWIKREKKRNSMIKKGNFLEIYIRVLGFASNSWSKEWNERFDYQKSIFFL